MFAWGVFWHAVASPRNGPNGRGKKGHHGQWKMWPCCLLPQLWGWWACTTHDWWDWQELQHTGGRLAARCQLWEVEGGEGGVAKCVWDQLWPKYLTITPRPFSLLVLIAWSMVTRVGETLHESSSKGCLPECNCIHQFQTNLTWSVQCSTNWPEQKCHYTGRHPGFYNAEWISYPNDCGMSWLGRLITQKQ